MLTANRSTEKLRREKCCPEGNFKQRRHSCGAGGDRTVDWRDFFFSPQPLIDYGLSVGSSLSGLPSHYDPLKPKSTSLPSPLPSLMCLEILLQGVVLALGPIPSQSLSLLFRILTPASLFISPLSSDHSPTNPLLLPPYFTIPFLISPQAPLHLLLSHTLRALFHPVFSATYMER